MISNSIDTPRFTGQHAPTDGHSNGHNTPRRIQPAPITGTITPADLAARYGLEREESQGRWKGANPFNNAGHDRFVLRDNGTARDFHEEREYHSKEVAELAGLSLDDYAPCREWRARNGHASAHTVNSHAANTHSAAPPPQAKPQSQRLIWEKATLFSYHDETGKLLFQVGRQGTGQDKIIRQRRPHPDKPNAWVYALTRGHYECKNGAYFLCKDQKNPPAHAVHLEEVRRVLYRLQDVMSAQRVFPCEGEKAAAQLNADLEAAGLFGPNVATTTPQGAGNVHKCDLRPLHGKAVVILPDDNKQGRGYRDAIGQALEGHATVRVCELPNRGDGGDYVDFRAAGHTLEDALALIDAAPEWEPETSPAPTNTANTANALTPRVRREPIGHTAAALLDLELPDPKWAVPGIIPEGVGLLVGPPKLGKSWFVLGGLCVPVATGGRALGHIEVEQGEVLYLALEDNDRRLKSRLQKVLSGERSRPRGLENLHLFTEWERVNEGGLARLEAWMQAHPNTRLIVIDTLQKIRPLQRPGAGIYGEDYGACEALKGFADAHGVAVVIVHHTRKADGGDAVESVSGSNGLTGGVDSVLTLKRDRGRGDASLFVTGRDLDEQDLALKWEADLCLWSILGDAEEYRMSTERANVANALREAGRPMSPKQIAEATGMKPDNVRFLLHKMRKANQIQDDGTGYTLTTNTKTVSGVSGVSGVSDISSVSNSESATNREGF